MLSGSVNERRTRDFDLYKMKRLRCSVFEASSLQSNDFREVGSQRTSFKVNKTKALGNAPELVPQQQTLYAAFSHASCLKPTMNSNPPAVYQFAHCDTIL